MPAVEIISPGETLSMRPESSAFAHGFGLFETMRVRSGRLELWEAHWRRLTASARALGMACPFEAAEVLDAVIRLAKQLPDEAVIKLSLLREAASSRMLVYSRPLAALPPEIGLLIATSARINEDSPLVGHKTHNYLENLLVLEAAHAVACYDGLRLNSKGELAEAAISNLFFHAGGSWHTPRAEAGLLPGVLREQLLEALAVEAGCYGLEDLFSADAVFLTNASVGLLPVDWLQAEGGKRPLSSRNHPCLEPAVGRLRERVEASAIQVS